MFILHDLVFFWNHIAEEPASKNLDLWCNKDAYTIQEKDLTAILQC